MGSPADLRMIETVEGNVTFDLVAAVYEVTDPER